jgi:hypothetical protein
MHLSQQKIDIDQVRAKLNADLYQLQSDINVLESGMKAIDAGEDMLNGNTMLALEVCQIMRKNTK